MARKATADVSKSRVRLRGAGAGVEVDMSLETGHYSVSDGQGYTPVTAAHAYADFDQGNVAIATFDTRLEVHNAPERFTDAHGSGIRTILATGVYNALRLYLEIAVYDMHPFALLRIGVENHGKRARKGTTLRPLVATWPQGLALGLPQEWRFFRHGWQSWTPTLSLSAAQRDIDAHPPVHAPAPPPSRRGAFASEEVGVLVDPGTGRQLLAGFVTARSQWTQVHADASRGTVEATAFCDSALLRPGDTTWSEHLLIDVTDDRQAAFTHYAEALGREMGARVPVAAPSGWCSWYEYFTAVTEEDLLKNLRFLQEHRNELPVQLVQIDDGYQADIGDWTTTNEKFPHGMAWLAREIREAGFTPGIWLAPLLVSERSRLFAEHPDWVVRDDEGEPALAMRNWGRRNFALDCTHPKAERWLRDLFREVSEDWGYDYVKIDFLYGGAIAGRRHDKNASRIEAYRRGLQAVRAGVGEERFVLGCGALMGPSVGLVDGMRIGPDVAPWWRFNRPTDPPRERGRPRAGGEPSVENALRNVFSRSWMHNRLWANDPDCLLAREHRTKLTLPEVQSLATAIALSGGMVLMSDDLTRLSQERLDIISLLLPPLGDEPYCPDLLESGQPSTLRQSVSLVESDEYGQIVGHFNWERRRRTLEAAVPPGPHHVFELWEERYYGVHERRVTLPDVPSHGVRLLALHGTQDVPQLLATTFHYSMGGKEIEDVRFDGRRDELRIDLQPVAKRRGAVYIHVPSGYRFADADLDGAALTAERKEPGVLAFRFDLTQPARLTARFVR
ncbi:MAG: glycoside hydrolase family 36 protein [Dehalococcoidia bacterium]